MRTKLPAGNPVAERVGTPGRWRRCYAFCVWWTILDKPYVCICLYSSFWNMFELKTSTFSDRSISEIDRAPNLGVKFPFAPLPGHFFDEQIANLAACSRLGWQTTRRVLVVTVIHRLVCSFRFCYRLYGPGSLVRGGRVGVWPHQIYQPVIVGIAQTSEEKSACQGPRMKFTCSFKTNYKTTWDIPVIVTEDEWGRLLEIKKTNKNSRQFGDFPRWVNPD